MAVRANVHGLAQKVLLSPCLLLLLILLFSDIARVYRARIVPKKSLSILVPVHIRLVRDSDN